VIVLTPAVDNSREESDPASSKVKIPLRYFAHAAPTSMNSEWGRVVFRSNAKNSSCCGSLWRDSRLHHGFSVRRTDFIGFDLIPRLFRNVPRDEIS